MRKKIVLALGGNALGTTRSEIEKNISKTAKSIVDLAMLNYDIIITHGNGPQVGDFLNTFNLENIEGVKLEDVTAMTIGYLGRFISLSVNRELRRRNVPKRKCLTLVTEILVDKDDEAFNNPTKPIGKFYKKNEIKDLSGTYVMDAGRGYRKVVPSPKPISILEINAIKDLVKKGYIVVTCGGGGIPVIKEGIGYKSVEAVIDKDYSSLLLAKRVKADILLILTDKEKVSINYGTKEEQELGNINVKEASTYLNNNEFARGSMYEKMDAVINFCKCDKKHIGIITSLQNAKDAVLGKTGTIVKNK